MTWIPNANKGDWLSQEGNPNFKLEDYTVRMTGDYRGKRYQLDITGHYNEIFEQAKLWREQQIAAQADVDE